jgi:hypothetical protein
LEFGARGKKKEGEEGRGVETKGKIGLKERRG